MPEIDGSSLVRAQLVSEHSAIRPGGEISIGVLLTIEPGWHTYWNGSNDTGFPASVTFDLPPGYRVGTLQWPVPTRHLMPGNILDHIYEDRVLLIAMLQAPDAPRAPDSSDTPEVGLLGSSITINASIDWLVCKEACLPGSADLSLDISLSQDEFDPPHTEHVSLFSQTREQLPLALPKPGTERAHEMRLMWNASSFIAIVPDAEIVRFFPGKKCAALIDPIHDTEVRGDEMEIRLDEHQLKDGYKLHGVLQWAYPDGQQRSYAVDFSWGDVKGLGAP